MRYNDYRNYGHTWHEYIDETGDYVTQLVPTGAHNSIGHSGGISELKEILKKLLEKVS
jgi:hypothetical protein